MEGHRSRRRPLRLALALAVITVLGGALALLQPWKLFVDVEVLEASPFVVPATVPSTLDPTTSSGSGSSTDAPALPTATTRATPSAPTADDAVRTGNLMSIAHTTSGRVTLGPVAGGGHAVYIENLDTDNGPDVRVYLSVSAADGDASALVDGGLHLGVLKGNKGNQSYAVPAGTDVTKYRSVVLWCERFSVAFGVAPIPVSAPASS